MRALVRIILRGSGPRAVRAVVLLGLSTLLVLLAGLMLPARKEAGASRRERFEGIKGILEGGRLPDAMTAIETAPRGLILPGDYQELSSHFERIGPESPPRDIRAAIRYIRYGVNRVTTDLPTQALIPRIRHALLVQGGPLGLYVDLVPLLEDERLLRIPWVALEYLNALEVAGYRRRALYESRRLGLPEGKDDLEGLLARARLLSLLRSPRRGAAPLDRVDEREWELQMAEIRRLIAGSERPDAQRFHAILEAGDRILRADLEFLGPSDYEQVRGVREALAWLDPIIVSQGGRVDIEALLLRAQAHRILGRALLERASPHGTARGADPDRAGKLLRIGAIHAEIGDWASVCDLLETDVGHHRSIAGPRALLESVCVWGRDPKSALERMRRAIDAYRDELQGVDLGWWEEWARTGRIGRPHRSDALLELGILWEGLGRPEKLQDVVERMTLQVSQPEDEAYLSYLEALTAMEKGGYEKAYEILISLLSIDPMPPGLEERRGEIAGRADLCQDRWLDVESGLSFLDRAVEDYRLAADEARFSPREVVLRGRIGEWLARADRARWGMGSSRRLLSLLDAVLVEVGRVVPQDFALDRDGMALGEYLSEEIRSLREGGDYDGAMEVLGRLKLLTKDARASKVEEGRIFAHQAGDAERRGERDVARDAWMASGRAYREASRLDPRLTRYRFQAGEAFFRAGAYSEAASDLEDFALEDALGEPERNAWERDRNHMMGEIARFLGRLDEAVEWYDRNVNLGTEDSPDATNRRVQALIGKALTWVLQERWDDAKGILQGIARGDEVLPPSEEWSSSVFYLGRLEEERAEALMRREGGTITPEARAAFEEGASYFEDFLHAGPSSRSRVGGRQADAWGMDRPSGVPRDRPHPDLVTRAYASLGRIHLRLGNHGRAEEWFERIVSQFPWVSGRTAEGDPPVRGRRVHPDLKEVVARALYFSAEAAFHDGRYREAIDRYRQALDRFHGSPFQPLGYLGKGIAEERLGEKTLALDTYRRGRFQLDLLPEGALSGRRAYWVTQFESKIRALGGVGSGGPEG